MATRPRPYRRILTSVLHRRFVHASALALLVDYGIAFVIGTKTSFLWSWFPVGSCGFRAILLFLSSLTIFILRVGQMHVGSRTTASPFATFRSVFPLRIIQTLGWYILSAWLFSEVYVWSSPKSANLGLVKPPRPTERVMLNERPIYLRSYLFTLAVVQAFLHLYHDYDHLVIPIDKRTPDSQDQRIHRVESVVARIKKSLAKAVADALWSSAVVTAVSPFTYLLFLRRPAWSLTLYFAKLFWDFPRAAADPPGRVPPVLFALLPHQAVSGPCLVFLWQATNVFFTVFMTKEPLRREQPLTTETKDPTGSLITGLKARKEVVRTFAFWELSFIAQKFADRRKNIFSDIDREGGPAWSQILEAAVETISDITSRIQQENNPPAPEPPVDDEKPQLQLETLPRLTDPPKEENILLARPPPQSVTGRLGESLGSAARSYGQAPDWTPAARAKAKQAITQASNVILSPERKARLLRSPLVSKTKALPPAKIQPGNSSFWSLFSDAPLLIPFRQSRTQRLRSVIFGTPHSMAASIIDAVDAIGKLLVASLSEDPYGKVQADVPSVITLWTDTIDEVESFVRGEEPDGPLPEDIDVLLHTLRTSLKEMLDAFEPYAGDIGLDAKKLRAAKLAIGSVEAES